MVETSNALFSATEEPQLFGFVDGLIGVA